MLRGFTNSRRLCDKESAKEKRAREREEAKRAREEDKKTENEVRAAGSAILKLEPIVASLKALRDKPTWCMVAEPIRTPVDDDYMCLTGWLDAANDVQANGGHLPFDVKTLTVGIGKAKKDVSLASSMLLTIARAAR
jgi:hypothetical protein